LAVKEEFPVLGIEADNVWRHHIDGEIRREAQQVLGAPRSTVHAVTGHDVSTRDCPHNDKEDIEKEDMDKVGMDNAHMVWPGRPCRTRP
jgi:hypothetical protein